ncbi:MAG: alpha/beta hydrolase [Desulfatiglans sp.]|jgi:pimeloyl-ACP methyl ester carboxylesterase|nr:alpha/beta hydrolase [Thermodesulfobacteriota bacterium]MEE4353812.1 alpha/beta hydrolase [Desulfatiglans sp.]
MPRQRIEGVDIYYEVHGDGDPLILIHHGIGCTRMWEKFLPAFSKCYKVIVYDRRGFGKSEKGEGFRDYYLNDQYNPKSIHELSVLLRHLDVDKPINIVGQCEGGAVGFHFAAEYPERVRAIVSSSTLCYSKTTVGELCKDKMFASFEDTDTEFRGKLIEWHGDSYAQELYALFMEMGGAYGSGVFDLRGTLKKVACPALVIYPDRSRLFDVEQSLMMYRALPQGELAVLPNCGHNTYEEQPDEYQKHILSFFERCCAS